MSGTETDYTSGAITDYEELTEDTVMSDDTVIPGSSGSDTPLLPSSPEEGGGVDDLFHLRAGISKHQKCNSHFVILNLNRIYGLRYTDRFRNNNFFR